MQVSENLMYAVPHSILMQSNPFHGAALLDEQGREVPITEEMIVQACNELMALCQFPKKAA